MSASSIRCEFDLSLVLNCFRRRELAPVAFLLNCFVILGFDFFFQDDAYIDSYISTIGVDFVSSFLTLFDS